MNLSLRGAAFGFIGAACWSILEPATCARIRRLLLKPRAASLAHSRLPFHLQDPLSSAFTSALLLDRMVYRLQLKSLGNLRGEANACQCPTFLCGRAKLSRCLDLMGRVTMVMKMGICYSQMTRMPMWTAPRMTITVMIQMMRRIRRRTMSPTTPKRSARRSVGFVSEAPMTSQGDAYSRVITVVVRGRRHFLQS